ncbi:ubiquitin protein ligase E3 mdm2, putative [Ixodes scapularis]|uniref:Ubiquitin protein ligase E3 mdm2, putative n=1 Tax=Ixodes scapularis TaxID=6945 RepID=B7QMD7_IXOSC|nr:ubiquitin protein ligase E3 mdm2, putative [Ixodes scapularis]|eukprot:XP_002416342.1 ubiquitin protein ligase E3 mdm2, putative [Ixodes scapularis]
MVLCTNDKLGKVFGVEQFLAEEVKSLQLPNLQILGHLKSYILERQLFDPKDPKMVLCANDKLGKVFGVEQFLAEEVKLQACPWDAGLWLAGFGRRESAGRAENDLGSTTLAKAYRAGEKLKRAATAGPSDAEDPKRARTEGQDAVTSSTPKRPSTPLVFFIPGSPEYDSGAESELSIQGHETDLVRDSTDYLWESEEEDNTKEGAAAMVAAVASHLSRLAGSDDEDCPFEVEYELESHSSGDGNAYSTDSDIVDSAPVDVVICVEEDAGFFADSSDSSHSSDSEIGEEDLWECRLCETQNTPLHRYCQKCWKRRFGWLPDRQEKHPPQKRRWRQRRERRHERRSGKSTSSPIGRDDERKPSPASLGSQGLTELRDLLEAGPSGVSQEVGSVQDPCSMCLVRPRTAILGHGKTSHRFGCYRCSRKLLQQNKRCPICRRHIDRVYHYFQD